MEGIVDLVELLRKLQSVRSLAHPSDDLEGADKLGAQLAPLLKPNETLLPALCDSYLVVHLLNQLSSLEYHLYTPHELMPYLGSTY